LVRLWCAGGAEAVMCGDGTGGNVELDLLISGTWIVLELFWTGFISL